MFNKRGQEDKLYFLIWEGVAIAITFIVILVALRGVVTNSNYWKRYYSIDMGLTADLMNTNQGDFVLNYKLKDLPENFLTSTFLINNKAFDIFLEADRFEIYDSPKSENQYAIVYPFAKHEYVDVTEGLAISKLIVFSKQGTQFTMSDSYTPSTNPCTKFIIPMTLDDITYLKFNVFSLDAGSSQVSKAISALLASKNPATELGNGPAIISSSNADPNAQLTIYYSTPENQLKSRKLACYISKYYSADSNFKSLAVQVLPYDSSLDSVQAFTDYVNGQAAKVAGQKDDFWVAIKLTKNEQSKGNQFAADVRKAMELYYG